MRVVIPQDPFWAQLWAIVDESVLNELACVEAPHEEPVVRWAHDAYDRILYRLPPDVKQLVLSHTTWREQPIPSQQELQGQRRPIESLRRADSQPLTPMHVIDVADRDLFALVTFQEYLAWDECDFATLIPEDLADMYRRALKVLTLIPPPSLLDALTPARGSSDAEVFLSLDAQAAYDTHRDQIIQVISGHNADLMACHRSLYT
ncbi:hypothetical protein ACWDBD_21565 [Streptomyces sp. NPDC001118]